MVVFQEFHQKLPRLNGQFHDEGEWGVSLLSLVVQTEVEELSFLVVVEEEEEETTILWWNQCR